MTTVSIRKLSFVQKVINPISGFVRRLVKESPLGTFGGVIVLLFLLTAILANFIAPYDFQEIHLADKLLPPSGKYLLGSDQLGRDVLSRIIYGARVSLFVGLGASFLNILIGTVIGASTPYIGGKFDLIVQRFVDAYLAFPGLILFITVMALIGQGMVQIIMVMGIGGGIGWSRTFRSQVYAIRENVYIEAGKAIGATTPRMIVYHVIPNILPVIVIAFTVSVAGNILSEAGLSFLGIGIPPPSPSWGQMLSLEGRRYMYEATWLAIWPGVALGLVIFGISMFGDAVRDIIDPRLRGGVGGMGSYGTNAAQKRLKRMQKKGKQASRIRMQDSHEKNRKS